MAQYILSDSFTAIAETSGTVINNSEVAVEINTTGISRTGITLFPRQHFPFSTSIYAARAPGAIGTAFIGVVPMSMGSGDEFTDKDVKDVFDDTDADKLPGEDDIDDILNDDYNSESGDFDSDENIPSEDEISDILSGNYISETADSDSDEDIPSTDDIEKILNGEPNGLKPQINKKAPIDSPALTGTPTAPTPAEGDNSTKLATTEFLQNVVNKLLSFADSDLNTFAEVIDEIKAMRPHRQAVPISEW